MNLVDINLDKNKLLESVYKVDNRVIENIMDLSQEELIEKISQANIKEGEKGGILIADKWSAALNESCTDKIFICNTYERNLEEDTSKMLLESNAKEIIQGMMIGAYSIGANKGYIYICNDNKKGIEKVREILSNVNSNIQIELKLINREAMYGDEIGSINILESKLNSNRVNKKYPISQVFNNKIVTINRPETLIKVYSMFLEEPYVTLSKDKFLILSGVNKCNDNIINVSNEITLKELIYNIGGGTIGDKEIKGIVIGGSTGVILPSTMLDIKLNDETIVMEDLSKTIRVTVLYSESCIIDLLRSYSKNNNLGTCNKCVLCREGSLQLYKILLDVTEGKSKIEDLELLKYISKNIKLGAGCSFGRNIPNIISSAIEYFYDEFEEHINRKKCSALVCKKYFTYHILGKECKGCEDCLEKCPAQAIEGGRNLIHVIDQDECTKCGLCLEACSYNAIVKAGLIKPKTPMKPVKVGTWKR